MFQMKDKGGTPKEQLSEVEMDIYLKKNSE